MTRIIAGSHRGRRIAVPAGDATRPTTDRVREALFSAIASWAGTAAGDADSSLAGLAVADLYAGSGAVGLEAASRGAGHVLLVESSSRSAALIRRNVAELELSGVVDIRNDRVERVVRARPARTYDVVFVDPPYALPADDLSDILGHLLAERWLAPDALLVIERSKRDAELCWPPGVQETRRRDYGETTLIFAAVPDEPVAPPVPSVT
jgi:16S rRNA (guanine966-N2)-methyltransferase